MRGNSHAAFGEGPTEKGWTLQYLAGGLLYSEGDRWQSASQQVNTMKKRSERPKPVTCPRPECKGRRARPVKGSEKDGTVLYLCYSCGQQWREKDHRAAQ